MEDVPAKAVKGNNNRVPSPSAGRGRGRSKNRSASNSPVPGGKIVACKLGLFLMEPIICLTLAAVEARGHLFH